MRTVHPIMMEPGKIYVSTFEKMELEENVWKSENCFIVTENKNGIVEYTFLNKVNKKWTYLSGKYYELTEEESMLAKANSLWLTTKFQ